MQGKGFARGAATKRGAEQAGAASEATRRRQGERPPHLHGVQEVWKACVRSFVHLFVLCFFLLLAAVFCVIYQVLVSYEKRMYWLINIDFLIFVGCETEP